MYILLHQNFIYISYPWYEIGLYLSSIQTPFYVPITHFIANLWNIELWIFDFIIPFAHFTLTLIHCHISCTIIFSLSIEVALSLPSFLCPSSTSFTIRDIMFIGYYVLLIWQTIISKEKSKNHFKHRLSRWKLPADTATAIFSYGVRSTKTHILNSITIFAMIFRRLFLRTE